MLRWESKLKSRWLPSDSTGGNFSQALGVNADGTVVAERTPVQVQASEAASLLDDLRLQLAAQPAARLSIRWQLTRPAEAK